MWYNDDSRQTNGLFSIFLDYWLTAKFLQIYNSLLLLINVRLIRTTLQRTQGCPAGCLNDMCCVMTTVVKLTVYLSIFLDYWLTEKLLERVSNAEMLDAFRLGKSSNFHIIFFCFLLYHVDKDYWPNDCELCDLVVRNLCTNLLPQTKSGLLRS